MVEGRACMPGAGVERVVVIDEALLPQIAACIVEVAHHGMAGVLIKEKHALAIEMAIAFLERGFQHPDAAQFVAHVVGVGMAGLEQIGVLHGIGVNLVRVGGNVDFLLAQILPVVALGRAIEETVGVNRHLGAHAAAHGLVKAVLGDLAHPACARVIAPAQALVLAEVDWLTADADPAFLALGQLDRIHALGHGAFQRLAGLLGGVQQAHAAVVGAAEDGGAILHHVGVVTQCVFGERAQRKQVVEGQFHAGLGEGERYGSLDRVVGTHSVGADHGVLRIGFGRGTGKVRIAEVAVARIDGNAESLWVARKQGLLAFGQIGGVLGDILGRDGEQGLFIGIGVHRVLACMRRVLNSRRRSQPFARVFGYAAGGAGLFGTDTGQGLAQLFNFFGAAFGGGCTSHDAGHGQRDQGAVAHIAFHHESSKMYVCSICTIDLPANRAKV